MNKEPSLKVAFLWHMHQPIYKNPQTNMYYLPWVRLHGVKSYYDMGKIVEEVEGAKVAFNFVPSLLEQLIDYSQGTASDVYLDYTLKDPGDMLPEEKLFLLTNFFHTHEEYMIRPYPRYAELLAQRGDAFRVQERLSEFSRQDYLDLQVWFNLTWFGQTIKDRDPEIHEFIQRGRGFSPQDKARIIQRQREIIQQIIPLYQGLARERKIELTTSPYYHPILPLLCDTEKARHSSPGIELPVHRFSYPGDALVQIRKGREYFARVFGFVPQGMWPPEGAVSGGALELMAAEGVKWSFSDEDILFNSLPGGGKNEYGERERTHLYRPYRWEGGKGSLVMFFRDHMISDLIGFVYHRWFTPDAVGDLLHRLSNLARELPPDRPNLICIILDGENAWEYYYRQGYDFLTGIYRGIIEHPQLEMVTFSEYLSRYPVEERLRNIFPGSWINADFRTWIGDRTKNLAWSYLARTRFFLEQKAGENLPAGVVDWELAWKEMLIAEGSDWFWWFGETHSSALDQEFDALFRSHLINVYRALGEEEPSYLQYPVGRGEEEKREPVTAVVAHMVVDGRLSNEEVTEGGVFSFRAGAGAMQRSQYLVEKVGYGFDSRNFYLRIEGESCAWLKGNSELRDTYGFRPRIEIEVLGEAAAAADGYQVCIDGADGEMRVYLLKKDNGWSGFPLPAETYALDEVLELAIPRDLLSLPSGEEVALRIVVKNEKGELERWPARDVLRIPVPDSEVNTTGSKGDKKNG